MSTQTFVFGHPCEHQLRRACIGGSSCPLNGYPDSWCCSFVKGKINFKRDKPCEGPRCRWGFTHPTQQQFDSMTQIIAEGRVIAAKLDDSGPNDLLTFQVDNPNTVDTIQCAMHMMRTPPSSCGRKVGQMLAYAAIKTQDSKVFTQLLKTMKKPIDSYLLGAYEYLTALNGGGQAAGSGKAGGASGKKSKKDDVMEELRSDIVDVMSSALSQNGQLVVRDDQHLLQAVFINALKTFPKNKKKQEMLENALAKYGNLSIPRVEPPELPPSTPPAGPAAAQSKPSRLEAPKPAEDMPGAALAPPAPAAASVHEPPAPIVPNKRDSSPTSGSSAPLKRTIGVSRIPAQFAAPHPRPFTPIDTPATPDVAILGGLFGLSSAIGKLCGGASALAAQSAAADLSAPFSALAVGASVAAPSNGFAQLFGPMDSNANAFGATADRQLLEGVMRAWGQ
jgi:hypothetical protein